MDVLTHLFLPLAVGYAVRPAWFESPAWFGVAAFGVLPDFDKFLGAAGLLHSLVSVVPLSAAMFAADRLVARRSNAGDAAPQSTVGRFGRANVGAVAVALVWSHLLLDVVDGGPVPLLFPLVEQGIGLRYPARVAFGVEPLGVAVRGPLVALRTTVPRPGFNGYGFVNGFGVASVLTFAAIRLGTEYGGRGCE